MGLKFSTNGCAYTGRVRDIGPYIVKLAVPKSLLSRIGSAIRVRIARRNLKWPGEWLRRDLAPITMDYLESLDVPMRQETWEQHSKLEMGTWSSR